MFFLLKYDIKNLLQWKSIRIWIAGIIVIVFVGILYQTKQEETNIMIDKIKIGVSDQDNSPYSKLILNFLSENDVFTDYLQITYGEEESLQNDIKKGYLDMIIIIPYRFVQSLIYIENIPVQVTVNSSDSTKAILLNNLLDAYEKYIAAAQINCVVLYDVMEKDGLPQELLDSTNLEISYDLISTVMNKNIFFNHVSVEKMNIPLIQYYAYELLFLLIVYVSMVCGIHIIKDQKAFLISRLTTTGMKLYWYYFEKLFFYTLLTTFLLVGIYSFRIEISGQELKEYINSFLFCFMVGILITSYSIAFSSIFMSIKSYLLASNMIVLFSLVIGGGVIPLLYLPQSMIRLAKFTPNYWFIMILCSIEEKLFSIKNGTMPFTFLQCMISLGVVSFVLTTLGALCYHRKERRAYVDA